MRKLISWWTSLNLKLRLFITTSALSIILALVIISATYALLPSLYMVHRENVVKEEIEKVVEIIDGRDSAFIGRELEKLTNTNIMYVKLESNTGDIIYERNKFLKNMTKFEEINLSREHVSEQKKIKIKGEDKEYILDITSYFHNLDDTSEAIRNLLPMILLIVIFFSFIGAYVYSGLITSPLLDIIDREKHQLAREKEFIGAISHELKTPITVISGQLEGMMYGIGKFKDRDLYIGKCYETTQELKTLVEKMINISKTEILEKKSHKSRLDINETILSVIEKYRFLYEEKNINFRINIRNKRYIYANKEDMITVFSNIISNAIKYSPKDENIILTLLEYRKNFTTPYVKLILENTGVTIKKDQIQKIFDPLYRIESSRNRNTGGSGMGLYFVSKILDDHGFDFQVFCRENSVVFAIEFDSCK